ncbi:MAG TPA: FAD-dependent oxidoreductase [Chloroflexota bacterium]|nr:FAD-dependent oxidoreductase [Chloroflexota bacterium]
MTTNVTNAQPEVAPKGASPPSGAAEPAPRRVLVLGGGVAGLTAAYELRRLLVDRVAITLISDKDRFILGPALLDVPFGRHTDQIGFALAPALQRRGISFTQASVERIIPERRMVLANKHEIPYDYLLVATGPWVEQAMVPGITGAFSDAHSIWTEEAALEAQRALERLLERPGPVVVGVAPGAAFVSAAYEFALCFDYTLRRHHVRDKATITFITPEARLAQFGCGTLGIQQMMERLFARRTITTFTGATITHVDRDFVYLQDGTRLPVAYGMIMPAFAGVPGIWHSSGLTDARGLVPVDARYRHQAHPEIYAVGLAARLAASPPAPSSDLPKTGYLTSVTARAAARSMAVAIAGTSPPAQSLPRLLDLRILDGGGAGLLLVNVRLIVPVRLALPLPGRTAHRAKRLLIRYILWKLRTGRVQLP